MMLKQIEMDTKINYMECKLREFMMMKKDYTQHQESLQRDSTKSITPQFERGTQTPTKISKNSDKLL